MEGTTLSHFRILERVGEGGMGVVYKAEDSKLGRTVAIKVLPPSLIGNEERALRFVKEARTAALISHPSIATVYEIDEIDGVAFIAMEYVEGRTLRSIMEDQPLPARDAVRIGTEIAECLAAAHKANVVHRDLKPENVLVTEDGHVKIIDFGLARLLQDQQSVVAGEGDETQVAQGQTQEGQILGTPAYMSPEQARGLTVDFRTDIFSFGTMLYEMVTGQSPFKAKTSTDTLSDVLNKDPLPVASLNPDMPSSVQWILDKCLEKDPNRRYQDTRDLVVDMQHLQPSGESFAVSGSLFGARTRSLPSWKASRSPWARILPIVVPAVLVLLLALFLPRFLGGDEQAASPVDVEANSLAIFSIQNLKDPEDPERLGQILQELLITDLSTYAPIKVFSSQRLFDIQKQLRTESEADLESATAVAVRAGADTMLTGSLSQLGTRWILTAQLASVATGTVIDSKKIDGTDLYSMVDRLTEEILNDLKVAMPAAAEAKVPVREKTTESIEAYQAYLSGVDYLNTQRYDEAVERLESSLEEDENFGQALYKLAIARWWANDNPGVAQAPLQRLLDEELYTTEKEMRMAEATMSMVSRDWVKGLESFQQLSRSYPDEKEVWYGLGEMLFHFPGGGKEDEALEALERAVALDPDFYLAYRHIFDTHFGQEEYDRALGLARELLERDPERPLWRRYLAASLEATGDDSGVKLAIEEALEYNLTPADRQDLYIMLGNAAGEIYRLGRQEQYLRSALKEDPERQTLTLYNLMVNNLAQQRKLEERDDFIRKFYENDPENRSVFGSYLTTYVRENRFDTALEKAREFMKEHPQDMVGYVTAAQAAVALADEEAVEEIRARASENLTAVTDKMSVDFGFGFEYMRRGDYVKARDYFEKGHEDYPDVAYAHLYGGAGLIHMFLRQLDTAEEWFRKGLEINPRMEFIYFGLSYIDSERGRHESAIQHASKLLEVAPNSSFAYSNLIYTYLWAGRTEEMQQVLEEGLETMKTPSDRWNLLAPYSSGVAWAFVFTGDYDRAAQLFLMAGAIDDEPATEVLSGLGMIHLLRGEIEEAERKYGEIRKREPRNHDGLRGLAGCRIMQGRGKEAERLIEEQMKYGPVESTSYGLLAISYLEQGKFQQAAEVGEKLITREDSRSGREILAWALIAGGIDVDRGLELAHEALEIRRGFFDPYGKIAFWPIAEHCLGRALLEKGQYQDAIDVLEQAAAKLPGRDSIKADLKRARDALPGS